MCKGRSGVFFCEQYRGVIYTKEKVTQQAV